MSEKSFRADSRPFSAPEHLGDEQKTAVNPSSRICFRLRDDVLSACATLTIQYRVLFYEA